MTGAALYWPARRSRRDLRIRDGFLVVVACWTAVCLAGAVPFFLTLDAGLADAIFESTSGLTTTGATVFVGLDDMPVSILRSEEHTSELQSRGHLVCRPLLAKK